MHPSSIDLSKSTILLTGAAGKVAKRLRKPLAAACAQLIVTDVNAIEDLAANERFVRCDLADSAAVMQLVQGVDQIIHFAAYPREADWETLIPANILGVTHVWEAALKHGVQRIVYASTNHVVGFYPTTQTIGTDAEYKCDSRYGVSKAFTEIVARFYYEKYGLQSLGLRIGRVEDAPSDERMLSTWLHPEDLLQQVLLGLTQEVKAHVIYGISGNSQAWCVNPNQGVLSQYEPKFSADNYAITSYAEGTASERFYYQGGPFATQNYRGETKRAGDFLRKQP